MEKVKKTFKYLLAHPKLLLTLLFVESALFAYCAIKGCF